MNHFSRFALHFEMGRTNRYTGLPSLKICCSQHFSQMEKKLEPNEINLSQRFSQKVVSTSCFVFNSLPTRGDLLSCDKLCKQFGPRSGPTKCWAWSGSKLFDTRMVLKTSSIQRVKYGTIIKCEEIIKAIFENQKADQKPLFCKYVIFESPRLYFLPMTYICNHSTFIVANGYNGYWQGEPWIQNVKATSYQCWCDIMTWFMVLFAWISTFFNTECWTLVNSGHSVEATPLLSRHLLFW